MPDATWFVGGYSTAADVIVEKSIAATGQGQKRLKLHGFMIHQASSVAGSTATFNLRRGPSSNNVSSTPVAADGGAFFEEVEGLGLVSGYFALAAPSTNVDGRVATMWGSYD